MIFYLRDIYRLYLVALCGLGLLVWPLSRRYVERSEEHSAANMSIMRAGWGGTLSQNVPYSRRITPRAEAEDSVYAFWYCNGRADLSRVRNINLGGIFIETSQLKDPGASVEIYFLVREGQIRAKAIVRHTEGGRGLGLKFTALNDQDRLHFGALMRRLYSARRAAQPTEPCSREDRPAYAKPSLVGS